MSAKLTFLFSFVLTLGLAASADAALVALYELDGNAIDSLGTNHGSEHGSLSYVSGVFGRAISLDGAGDYVDCGNAPVFDITDEITVAAWVNINTVPDDWTTIIAKGDTAWRLSTDQSDSRFHFAICGSPWENLVSGVTEVNDGEWHHVCGTYDRAMIRLYVDGVLDANKVCTDAIPMNSYSVCIGENSESPGRYWDGLIDDVAVFDHALNTDEINQLIGLGGASFILPCGGASLVGDINVDCRIDFDDFALLAEHWLMQGSQLSGDIYEDGRVDWLDVSLFVNNWLAYMNLPPKVYAGSDRAVGLLEDANYAEVYLDGSITAGDGNGLVGGDKWPEYSSIR